VSVTLPTHARPARSIDSEPKSGNGAAPSVDAVHATLPSGRIRLTAPAFVFVADECATKNEPSSATAPRDGFAALPGRFVGGPSGIPLVVLIRTTAVLPCW
jgi:hypothetical protein